MDEESQKTGRGLSQLLVSESIKRSLVDFTNGASGHYHSKSIKSKAVPLVLANWRLIDTNQNLIIGSCDLLTQVNWIKY